MLNRGEIVLANLNPNKGTEPGKTRPVLIIQNQYLLDVEHPSTLIIPLTTNLIADAEPLRIRVKKREKLTEDSDLLIDQIRAIDNQRIQPGVLATIEIALMERILLALNEILGA